MLIQKKEIVRFTLLYFLGTVKNCFKYYLFHKMELLFDLMHADINYMTMILVNLERKALLCNMKSLFLPMQDTSQIME
jgi:hypothetical protein